MEAPNAGDSLGFHHIQMYVDEIKSMKHYKDLEATFSKFSAELAGADSGADQVKAGKAIWEGISGTKVNADEYKSAGQDVVEQMITGLGWRVTGEYAGSGTYSVAVTSPDATGAKFVMTTRREPAADAKPEQFDHFAAEHVSRFYGCHVDRPGIAVLCFEAHKAGAVDSIFANYKKLHPALLVNAEAGVRAYGGFKVLEVFAYYSGKEKGKADEGTVIRFVEREGEEALKTLLPGLNAVEASFPADCFPAFSDHWVSNVFDRKQFLSTLKDTLGFTPKVDFNAGVVAAGEAIIESTVTGNTAPVQTINEAEVLVNQQQVYLPINNALSEVGHVHLFLEEIGQGIQHIASRVKGLVGFIQRTNRYREMTGQGLSFLRIPRSYYGRLELSALKKEAGCSDELAAAVLKQLQKLGSVSITGVADLKITREQAALAANGLAGELRAQFDEKKEAIVDVVLRSRYANLVKLLQDHLSEETYLKIVENAILVDIQAGDVLYQIFTANILQRAPGQESPFLEFIQRVCSEKKDENGKPKPIRPGCGGFGIRNFLTLFLSIEVSKAMLLQDQAAARGDEATADNAAKMVELFTAQLDESNPVLTMISDAMTAEADALLLAESTKDEAAKAAALVEAEAQKAQKNKGQQLLKDISERYVNAMGELRK